MLKSYLTSFILFVGCANSILSQQVRPLPNPVINIQCGQWSGVRRTGLLSPRMNQQVPTTCTYRISAISFQICQMRFEFRQFSLAPPTLSNNGINSNGAAFQMCNDEHMTVGNITLCGENTGQHIYVPINPRQGERQLTVTITTRGGNGFTRPEWNIAVHQLECPLGQSRSLNVIQASTAQKLKLNETVRTPRTLVSDWLAPPGCLQYYVQPSGQIDSFNFNNGQGPYIGDMNYAICFRRQRGDQAIKFITTFFQMNTGNPANQGFDDDCFGQEETLLRSEDHLFIPNASLETRIDNVPVTLRPRLFCGRSLSSSTVTSTPPGPFMIAFNSDRVYSPSDEIGFRMQYEIV
ncbi:CLUMA_CG019555, isoform A [Clunio marinus]|uniref:CLUMA_CG019555, isoform A n=1 Tax=Clunio marinus TaxID=568069 RepID=A0A1J1J2V6_9DIPT|nr:CLUMA_CG019555, isoform A [Clunio marinus]